MTRLLPIALFLLLPACTTLNVAKGTYYTNADNQDVTIAASKGQITYYHAQINNHSIPVRAYGSVIGTSLSGAALLMGTSGMSTIVK